MHSVKLFYESPFRHTVRPIVIRQAVKKVFENELKSFNYLNVIFCNDAFLLNLNKNFLNHNTYTDIITFNYSNIDIEGELYISFERLKENSEKFKVPIQTEILRLIIHGCLHLCGYQDKTKNAKAKMTELENSYLAILKP